MRKVIKPEYLEILKERFCNKNYINKYKYEDNSLKIMSYNPAIIRKVLLKQRLAFSFCWQKISKDKKDYSKQDFPT